LGEIPAHWDVKRLKWFVRQIGSGKTPKGGAQIYSESGIIFLRSQNIHFEGLRLEDVVYIDEHIDEEMASTRVQPRDVLLNITGASLGRCSLVPGGFPKANVNQHVCIIRPDATLIDSSFLQAAIASESVQSQIFSSENGTSREGLTFAQVANLVLTTPKHLSEQKAISFFLDHETSHIDALIAKKERLIELLTEKRSSLISHLVTKGLDPRVPMKDSGVEWLGQIPHHWEVTRLKFLTPEITVGIVVTPAKYYVDDGIPCLRSLNVREDGLKDTDLVFISAESNQELRKSMIFAGDLVSVRTGQPGTTTIVDERFHRANCIDLIITRQSKNFHSHFMVYLLNSPVAKEQYGIGAEGAIQKHFNIETAKNLSVMLPSKEEQSAIVTFLDSETFKIDALTIKVRAHIEKLKEYRTALISAAVTGKIDVRGEGA
jgi:type I restriction enzyme S subunit